MNQLRILLQIMAVAGVLLFSSYGNAGSQAQKQLSSKANQTISFKGIPLGKAGAKEALQKICMGKKFNTMNDRCSFTGERSMILLDYETLVDAFASVTLNSDKALVKIAIDGSTQEMLALAKALEKKYGVPLKKKSIVKIEIGTEVDKGNFVVKEAEGTQLDKETFIWVDDQGSRITIESIYSDYDKGGVIIESSLLVAAQDAAAKKAKEPAK